MATRKLSLSTLLRRRYHQCLPPIYSSILSSSSNSSSSSSSIQPHQFNNQGLATHIFSTHGAGGGFLSPCNFSSASTYYRSFSTDRRHNRDGPTFEGEELSEPGFFDYNDAGIADEFSVAAGGGEEEAILPVRCLVWFLDGVHDHTGLPWWFVIAISTLAVRVALLPVLLVQLRKLKRNAELAPQ